MSDEENLVDELARIHREVSSKEQISLDSHSSTQNYKGESLSDGLSGQLDSARRVMQLLASMRPIEESQKTRVDVEAETQSDVPLHGGLEVAPECGLPQSIGGFEIISLLGQGGFGMVFRAHDHQL